MMAQAIPSLWCGVCAVAVAAVFSLGLAALKRLLFKACKRKAQNK